MTRVIWQNYEQTPLFEDMVSVLISRLHPTAERIDGTGGDGGRDVQLRTPGKLDLFEVKSFTGRLSARSPNRRSQVEKSLRTAAALQPDSWTLIVPINHNESELKWFDGLCTEYDFPLSWKGRDWLDDQMGVFPDIRRYYLEGAADEVVRLLAELSRDDAPITEGVGQAVQRLKAIQARLHDIDPQYRIEVSPGPVAAAVVAYPNAVMYVEETHAGEEPWTISVLAKYRDATRDRPIQIKANLVFDGTPESSQERSKYLEMMRFGSDEPLVVRRAEDLTIDAPAGLGGIHGAGTMKLSSLPEQISLPARIEVTAPDGEPVGSLSLRLTNRSRGTHGVTLTGSHDSGLFAVRLRAREDLSASMNLTVNPVPEYAPAEVLPLLRTLAVMTAPNLVSISIEGQLAGPPDELPATSVINIDFLHLVEGIAKMQAETGTYFRVLGDPTAEDVGSLNRILRLLDGGELAIKPPQNLDLIADANEPKSEGDVYPLVALQFWHTETFMQESIPLGPCVALAGPYAVSQSTPGGENWAVRLSSTPDTRSALRRGQLTDKPVLPGGGVQILIPHPASEVTHDADELPGEGLEV